MRVLLISTYDLGRQPFGLASPAAWLREAGIDVTCADLSRGPLPADVARAAGLVAFFLPMHTATRLALPVVDRVREMNPGARLCAYGLYAPLNAGLLHAHGVTDVLAGEFEEDLLEVVRNAGSDAELNRAPGDRAPRLRFRVPDRTDLPGLARYATLQMGSSRRITGYTEASRGCKHRCRHCPIVPVYNGQFRIVPIDVVVEDIRRQVRAGAGHITFGDPDFFNGTGHARALVAAFAREFPDVTYDVTIKVEHLLRHADLVPLLHDTGCAFVTTAVESLDDGVLAKLEKGHTREDFERVVTLFQDAELPLSPTFVAFTPWTTLASYCELLHGLDRLRLVENVAPIQLAIRLLVTEGSRLLELEDVRRVTAGFDARSLTFPWRHPDPRVDALQRDVAELVGVRLTASRSILFGQIWDLAHEALGTTPPVRTSPGLPRAAVPYLNEPWYC